MIKSWIGKQIFLSVELFNKQMKIFISQSFTDNAVLAVYYLCLFPVLVNINRAGVFWVCSFRHFLKKDFYLKH